MSGSSTQDGTLQLDKACTLLGDRFKTVILSITPAMTVLSLPFVINATGCIQVNILRNNNNTSDCKKTTDIMNNMMNNPCGTDIKHPIQWENDGQVLVAYIDVRLLCTLVLCSYLFLGNIIQNSII